MGKYIHNLETNKIELHFDKSEYMGLSDEQKKEIKSNFYGQSQLAHGLVGAQGIIILL